MKQIFKDHKLLHLIKNVIILSKHFQNTIFSLLAKLTSDYIYNTSRIPKPSWRPPLMHRGLSLICVVGSYPTTVSTKQASYNSIISLFCTSKPIRGKVKQRLVTNNQRPDSKETKEVKIIKSIKKENIWIRNGFSLQIPYIWGNLLLQGSLEARDGSSVWLHLRWSRLELGRKLS